MMDTNLHFDLYEINMSYAYFKNKQSHIKATFEVYFRNNPFNNGHCVFCGSEHIIEAVKNFRFDDKDIAYLKTLECYDQAFLDYLVTFKFSGNIYAPTEGEIVFANEPIIVVEAPIIEAQLIETLILNIINFQILIATKASKMVQVTDKPLYEFGARRGYELDASLWGARASIIAGFKATSLVSAAKLFDLPVVGTHAHSFIQMHQNEETAFINYAKCFDNVSFLVDTYNVLESGIPHAIDIANKLPNITFKAIRIDSGDLAYLSKQARQMLDAAGYEDVEIMVSNDLDEHIIVDLNEQGAPIDAFGIGTKLVSCSDTSSLGAVYKLVHLDDNGIERDVIKISNSKAKISNPGVKMPYRLYDCHNCAIADVIAPFNYQFGTDINAYDDNFLLGYKKFHYDHIKPLLFPIIENGKDVSEHLSVMKLQENHYINLADFSKEYLRYSNPQYYPICLLDSLYELKLDLIKGIEA